MINIDGSLGEGGGQVLRSSLGLSLVTGKPFKIINIRSKRRKPGLMRQHLTAVNAAVEIGRAEVEGNKIGGQTLFFKPGKVRSGEYHFSVGTAGSCTLVLQAVLPALVLADGPSEIILEGGTHNHMAPPFDFLGKAFLPIINKMGPRVRATLERPGFYPAGGGRFTFHVEPAKVLEPLAIEGRGELKSITARAVVSKLPIKIAHRELKVVGEKLRLKRESLRAEEVDNSPGPGNILTVEVVSDHITEVFTGFGERGVASERVAGKTVKLVRSYLAGNAPVGRYLADQLLIYFALAGGGGYKTLPPTRHTETNISVVKQFLEADISLEERGESLWKIQVNKLEV